MRNAEPESTGPVRRRWSARRVLAVLTVAAVAMAGVTWWLGSLVSSPGQAAAKAKSPKASPITAPVEHRALVNTLVARGTIRAGREQGVKAQVPETAGLPLVTKVPVKTGQRVSEGTLIAEVAQRPVFVLQGRGPMFRDLSRGARGRDVAQLQSALARLGYPSGDAHGRFSGGTASAVTRFYRARGYQPLTATSRPDTPDGDRRAAVRAGVGEIVFVRDLPAYAVSVSAKLGGQASGELVRLASGEMTARVKLTAEDAQKVKRGAQASIEVEGTGDSFKGTVSRVGKAAKKTQDKGDGDSEEQEGEDTPYEAKVTSGRQLRLALRGEEVRATIDLGGTTGKVLVVPVAAVWSRADGRSYVEITDEAGKPRQVQVTQGATADGYTEIKPANGGQVKPGDLVVVGQERK